MCLCSTPTARLRRLRQDEGTHAPRGGFNLGPERDYANALQENAWGTERSAGLALLSHALRSQRLAPVMSRPAVGPQKREHGDEGDSADDVIAWRRSAVGCALGAAVRPARPARHLARPTIRCQRADSFGARFDGEYDDRGLEDAFVAHRRRPTPAGSSGETLPGR